jgi:hypothetical protein
VPTLIYVHGRGLKPPKEQERKNWLDALNRGLARLDPPGNQLADTDRFRLAYWSDLFYPPEADPSRDASATGVSDPSKAGLSGPQALALAGFVERFWSWRLGQPATPAEDDPQVKQFEDNFVRDVIKFFGLGYGDACAEPLRQELRSVPGDDPVALVSHSFGTVLAYEVLVRDIDAIDQERATAGLAPLRVDTWVTMGSPLGWAVDLQAELPAWQAQLIARTDQSLQPALLEARACIQAIGDLTRQRFAQLLQHLTTPAAASVAVNVVELAPKQFPPRSVDRWFNIYDPRDPVACAGGVPLIHGGLAVGTAFLFQGQQRAFDVTIRNEGCPPEVVRVDMRAHQDYTGYGQCVQLAQLVSDFWDRAGGQWRA